MIGKLISIKKGPERNVKLTISPTEVWSEISSPSDPVPPARIGYYEVSGMDQPAGSLIILTLVLVDQQRVRFYATHSQFDMGLLLDQLDGTINQRKRVVVPTSPSSN
jgi:hypothetical protein